MFSFPCTLSFLSLYYINKRKNKDNIDIERGVWGGNAYLFSDIFHGEIGHLRKMFANEFAYLLKSNHKRACTGSQR